MDDRYKKAVETRRRKGSYRPMSDEEKKRLSDKIKKSHKKKKYGFQQGHKPWNKGVAHSNETKKKLSKATKKQFKEKGHPFQGMLHSEESKRKMSKSRTGKSIGKERWNWRGGVSSQNRLIRTSSKWRTWRKKVFERDNYTCQNKNCKFCGNMRGIKTLHPHHIKPICIAPELGFNVSNGVTLCQEYHMKGGLH